MDSAVGQEVRRLRGKRSRAVFAAELRRVTGVTVSAGMLYHAEEGNVRYRMPDVVRALWLAYPVELTRFFLPPDIITMLAETPEALSVTVE